MDKSNKDFANGLFGDLPPEERNRISGALKKGSLSDALSAMHPEDAKKARELMSDRAALEKLLKSPEAQKIIKMFSGPGGGGNGER